MTRLSITFARGWQGDCLQIADRDRREAAMKFALRLERRDSMNNVLAIARAVKPIADVGEQWDTDPWLLGAANGVVDLRTGDLRDGRRDDCITLNTGIAYDADATSELWDTTLRDVLLTDDMIAFFQCAVG